MKIQVFWVVTCCLVLSSLVFQGGKVGTFLFKVKLSNTMEHLNLQHCQFFLDSVEFVWEYSIWGTLTVAGYDRAPKVASHYIAV
jgi:hypothetical protein